MPATSKSVLVIDDQSEIRNLISRVLERAEYKALCVEDIASGTAVCQQNLNDICCILLDYSLCKVTPPTIVNFFREIISRKPVIVMSGGAEQHFDLQHYGIGRCDAYLAKPFGPSQLYALINKVGRHC